jgi:hypothetical protein
MSQPLDQHTLAIVVAGLRAALRYEWRDVPGGPATDVRAARQAATTLVAWGRELLAAPGCANCGSSRPALCPECDWPLGAMVPAGDFCSICRRHHGREITHACE